ncbi:MAG: heavy metal-associated domain-containing protein [Clostridiales bacterium]
MKKTYKLINLGCANCADKMENKIKKIDGVTDANINFIMAKLIIEGEAEKWDDIMPKAAKICKTIESKCRIDI